MTASRQNIANLPLDNISIPQRERQGSNSSSTSRSSDASGVLTPTSSDDDLRTSDEEPRQMQVEVTVTPPPVANGIDAPLDVQLERLQLRGNTSSSPSLSAARQRRRSSSSGRSPRYEIEDEQPPASSFYRREFQDALRRSKDLAGQLASALSSDRLHTDEASVIHGLYQRARDASEYRSPRSWSIGLVGDSGTGKSSLINSLLDMKMFARASSSGAACTCTVTEYHYHNTPAYTVKVSFFTREQLRVQFEELLRAYRLFHSQPTDDQVERRALEETASVAWHTFTSAFRSQPLLNENFLLRQDERAILNCMDTWIAQYSPQEYREAMQATGVWVKHFPCGETSGPEAHAAARENCSALLERLTSDSRAGAVATWPYIETVKVFLNANILSKGLILIDLPGLRDTNSARRMITERNLVKCDQVFAIGNIARATSDQGIKVVIDLATRTRRGHVGIVCTRSDDINLAEAERDWTGTVRDTVETLGQELRESEEAFGEVDEEIGDVEFVAELMADSDQTAYRGLLSDHRRKRVNKEDCEYRLRQLLVRTRNNAVSDSLRATYPVAAQNVFCVSNKIYWDKREDPRASALQWLGLSQIVGLRRHCLGLVAAYQWQDATVFMNECIPNLVEEIHLWVQSGSGRIAIETRQRIREISVGVENILRMELGNVVSPSNDIATALGRQLDDWLNNNFANRRDRAWKASAQEAADDWGGYTNHSIGDPRSDPNLASYAAFCRGYGTHTTGKVGFRCWNEEIIGGMKNDLTDPWDLFGNSVKAFFRRRSAGVSSCFDRASGPLEDIGFRTLRREEFDSVQTLIRTMQQRKALLKSETCQVSNDYFKSFGQVADLLGQTDFLSGIRTSFIGQHMEDAYRAAARDSGTGVFARQRACIGRKVTDPDLFNKIQRELSARFGALTRDVEVKIREANRRHFVAVRAALDILRDENVIREGEQKPEFRERLREQVVDAQRMLDGISGAVRVAVTQA